MAKRLTCSDKWQDPWFRKLTPELKCVWLFLLDKCDNAGVWKKDIDLMEFVIGCKLDENNILDSINNDKKRIDLLDNEKWLVVDFIRFQWKNNHKMLPNINKLCVEHGIDIDTLLIGYTYPIDRTKVKVKVKVKDKVEVKVKDDAVKEIFDFWNEKGIIQHRNLKTFTPCINSKLEIYSQEEIKQAISNYDFILKSDDYYWSHSWGIDEFLTRKGGLDKFLDLETAKKNFKKENNYGKNRQSNTGSNSQFECVPGKYAAITKVDEFVGEQDV